MSWMRLYNLHVKFSHDSRKLQLIASGSSSQKNPQGQAVQNAFRYKALLLSSDGLVCHVTTVTVVT